jgi:hypothetical protein
MTAVTYCRYESWKFLLYYTGSKCRPRVRSCLHAGNGSRLFLGGSGLVGLAKRKNSFKETAHLLHIVAYRPVAKRGLCK